MTIHRKGTRLVKIKIRPEAVVNRTHTAGGHTAAPFNSSTRKNRLLPVAYACPLSPIFFIVDSRNSRTNRGSIFREIRLASLFAATRIYRYLENSYMDATWCICGSKEGKSGGRWKDSLSSLRFVRPFFSSRAFNVNIFREEIGEFPPLFPIPFLCFPPVYSRSIRGGDPLDPRSSTLARPRFSFHASFLRIGAP